MHWPSKVPSCCKDKDFSAGGAAASQPLPWLPPRFLGFLFSKWLTGRLAGNSGSGSLMYWKPSLFPFSPCFPWWARKRSCSLTGRQGWGPGVLSLETGIYHCDTKTRHGCIYGGEIGWRRELLSHLGTVHWDLAMTLRFDWLIGSGYSKCNQLVLQF